MSGTLWVPGAARLTPSSPGGTITSTAPPRIVWHTVEAPAGKATTFAAMIRVLTGKKAEPHLLYDPITDRLGQFFPLNLSGRALKNDGATRTNRVGRVCVQIEVIGYSSKPFTDTWKPGPNFRSIMAALRSHGIVEEWPAGAPPKYIDSPPHNVPESPRSRGIWTTKGGHFSHSQIPGNDHGDPGGINVAKLFAAGKATGGNTPAPPTGEFTVAQTEAIMAKLEEILGADGDRYSDLKNTMTKWMQEQEDKRAAADKARDDAMAAQLDALTAAVEALKAG
jgi:hypothetical protein